MECQNSLGYCESGGKTCAFSLSSEQRVSLRCELNRYAAARRYSFSVRIAVKVHSGALWRDEAVRLSRFVPQAIADCKIGGGYVGRPFCRINVIDKHLRLGMAGRQPAQLSHSAA